MQVPLVGQGEMEKVPLGSLMWEKHLLVPISLVRWEMERVPLGSQVEKAKY